MKKRIKDLTREDTRNICKKHMELTGNCFHCPLFELSDCSRIKEGIQKFLDMINKEVEILDEEKV